MVRLWSGGALLAFALFSSGCDSGASYGGEDVPIKGNPNDQGSDEDLGSEDMGPTPVERHGALRVVGSQLRDAEGDVVQLKGVSSMWLNWETDGYAENASALRWMRNNWNLKVIRAAMGIAPQGAYLQNPERAKEQVVRIVDNAIEAGVYVIIDWHDHDAHEHEADAVAFFAEMAEKYAGVPNVLYEPFNEPTGVAWPEIKAYHESVVATIREYDSEAIIILGTANYSQEVDVAALDPVEGTNLMYTLHYYACDHAGWLRLRGETAIAKGLALFITEWGATDAQGGLDGAVCLRDAQDWDDWMNQYKLSWAAWKLDNCSPDSTCLLAQGAPLEGGWTNEYLHGHAPFVRGRMQR